MEDTKIKFYSLIVQRVKKSQIAIGMNFRKNCNLHEAGMLWYHCLHPMKYHVIIKIYHWLTIQSKTKIDKVEFSFLFRFFLHSYYETHLAKVYSQRNSFYDLILKEKKIAMMQTIIFLLSMWYFFQGGIISLIKYWKSQPTRRGNETLWIFF